MFLAGILLLSALTPISYSLMCTECRTTNSTSCTGKIVACRADYICASSYTEMVNSDGTSSSELIRSCANSTHCNYTGSFSLATGKMWMFTSCCDSDNCTSPIVTAPSFSSQPNGLICPSCQALDSDGCYDGNTVPCYGDEIECVLYTTTRNGNVSSVRGCGPRSVCGGQTYRVNGSVIRYNLTCIGGGYALTCPECRATNSTSCSGDYVTCKANYLCASSYTEVVNSNGTSSSELIRSCAPSSQCSYTGTITLPTGKMWMSSSCCSSDNCTSPIVTAPPFSTQPNGLICPSCQALGSDWCYNGNTVPCYGDENVCVLHTTTRDGTLTPTTCSDSNLTCAAGTVCATVHAVTTMGDAKSERFTKKCSPINQCGISGVASIPKGKMKIMTVCSSNGCTLPFPSFPSEKTAPNGVTCKKCIAVDTDCYTSETMQCTGDESACLLQSTTLTGRTTSRVAMRSCTTKNICDLTRQDYTTDGIVSATKFTCTSGTAPAQRSFLAFSVSLFILKSLI